MQTGCTTVHGTRWDVSTAELWRSREHWFLFSLKQKKSVTDAFHYLVGGWVSEKMKAGSSWKHAKKEQETTNNMQQEKFWTHVNKILPTMQLPSGVWKYSDLNWIRPWPNLFKKLAQFWAPGCTGWSPEAPSNQNCPIILWFYEMRA